MLWCYHFKIIDYPLFCGRIQFYCDVMTSKLMIAHYFAIELICIAMRSLQRWWLTTILLTVFSCCHYFVGWIRRTQCGGPRAMRAIFVALFREPSSIYFVIELICIVMRSLQKWWLTTISWTDFRASHFFVGRIRRMQWGGPTKYKCVHENTLQQLIIKVVKTLFFSFW